MLQEIPTPSCPLRASGTPLLQTARLTLRPPQLGDALAVSLLANDRRIAENTRRLPHPYRLQDAVSFIASLAETGSETVWLIEQDGRPIGMVGVDWRDVEAPELGYWLGVAHWGQGFGTEAARAVIDYVFEEFDAPQLVAAARVVNPASRNILEKCGFQWKGVELHRFAALGSSSPVDSFRLSRGVWSSLKSWGQARRGR